MATSERGSLVDPRAGAVMAAGRLWASTASEGRAFVSGDFGRSPSGTLATMAAYEGVKVSDLLADALNRMARR